MNPSGLDQPRVSRVLVERYVAKLRKRRRWRRLSITLTVLLLALTTTGYYVGWHTKVFDVRTTTVRGAKVLTSAQVVAAARIPPHQPVAAVDTTAVKARITAIPRVASAVVERDFPHGVVITIVERVPAAALPDPSGSYTIVDADGVAFDTTTSLQAVHVPVINLTQAAVTAPADPANPANPAVTATQLPPADPAKVRAQVITGSLAALRALPDPLRARVRGISATGPYSITLELTPSTSKQSKVTVNWGGGDQPELKARILTILIGRGASHYDVSAPEAPAFS